ncbi:MAG: RNA 3'-terminal phosphate cyclase, partial [Pyrinomonadaceae bacterium]
HEARRYLDAGAPGGCHLADQLLIPLALARGGSYVTQTPTPHTTTNIEVIKKLLPVEIITTQLTEDVWKIEVFG